MLPSIHTSFNTRMTTIILLIPAVVGWAQFLPLATFTVGGDGACGYSDLQVALLATLLNGPRGGRHQGCSQPDLHRGISDRQPVGLNRRRL